MNRVITLLVLGLALGAQSFSQDFPLVAHVKRIEQDKKLHEGTTQTWHLVTAEIDGHTYGLEVTHKSFHRLDWLHVGDYPCQRTKHGFEFQYQDGGKTHTREFAIVNEE
jgi:hypothetical protein